MAKKPRVVIQVPDADTPGFFKRQQRTLEIAAMFEADTPSKPGDAEKLVEYLLPYVAQPADRAEAADLLWDLSLNELQEVFAQLRGGAEVDAPPLAEQKKSASISEASKATLPSGQ